MKRVSQEFINYIIAYGGEDGIYYSRFHKRYKVVKIEDEKVVKRKVFDDLVEVKKWAEE